MQDQTKITPPGPDVEAIDQDEVNSAQPFVNPTQPGVNPAQPFVNPAQPGVNQAQPAANPPNHNMANPAVSYERPKPFNGRPDQDPMAWIERFEVVAHHNRRQDVDKLANFPLFLEEAAAGWYLTLQNQPNQWGDMPEAENLAAIRGMKTSCLNILKPADYKIFQEQKLMKRAQGLDEPLLSYYFDLFELCRNFDPAMSEERKVGHLLNGLKPTLAERIVPYEVADTSEFLERAKILVRAFEFANTPGRNQTIIAAAQAKIAKNPTPDFEEEDVQPEQKENPISSMVKNLMEHNQAILAYAKFRKQEPSHGPKKEESLTDRLSKLFLDPPEVPKTADDRIIEGIQQLVYFKKQHEEWQQNNTTVEITEEMAKATIETDTEEVTTIKITIIITVITAIAAETINNEEVTTTTITIIMAITTEKTNNEEDTRATINENPTTDCAIIATNLDTLVTTAYYAKWIMKNTKKRRPKSS